MYTSDEVAHTTWHLHSCQLSICNAGLQPCCQQCAGSGAAQVVSHPCLHLALAACIPLFMRAACATAHPGRCR